MEITTIVNINDITEEIKKSGSIVTQGICYIGALLTRVKENELFKQKGYNNVYEYAEKELNYKSTQTKGFIAVAEQFALRLADGLPGNEVDPKYADFNMSQLIELAPLKREGKEEVLEKITPDMKIKEIKEVKAVASGRKNDQSKITDLADVALKEVIYKQKDEPKVIEASYSESSIDAEEVKESSKSKNDAAKTEVKEEPLDLSKYDNDLDKATAKLRHGITGDLIRVSDFLIDFCSKDSLFIDKVLNENKSILKCVNYIIAEARRRAEEERKKTNAKEVCVNIADDVAFDMSIHYFDEENV